MVHPPLVVLAPVTTTISPTLSVHVIRQTLVISPPMATSPKLTAQTKGTLQQVLQVVHMSLQVITPTAKRHNLSAALATSSLDTVSAPAHMHQSDTTLEAEVVDQGSQCPPFQLVIINHPKVTQTQQVAAKMSTAQQQQRLVVML